MKKIFLIALASLMVVSCERDTDTLGPNLTDIYGEFQVFEEFESDKFNVDFRSGQNVGFSARFSKTVDWEVKIIGQRSQATKILSGKSKTIDEITGRWNGTTTNLPMFKDELCNAILTIEEENYADTIVGIKIDSTRQNEGFVVADFENGINSGWLIFKQSGADMTFLIIQSDSAAEQVRYYDMGGEVTFDYLIGYIYFPATAYGETTFPLPSNPDNVYFNVMLGKPEGISNDIILFQFTEDDNEDGVFNEATEDMYSLELKNIDPSWTQISIKYSDLVALVNGAPANPNGNGIHEPHKLLEIRTLFLADPSSGFSQTYMDYMIFTENEALVP